MITPKLTQLHGTVRPGGKIKQIQRPSERHGGVITYSQEVITRANAILETQGQVAYDEFLRTAKGESTMETENQVSGSIENSVKEARANILRLEEEIRTKMLELERWKQIRDCQLKALSLLTAPRNNFASEDLPEVKTGRINWMVSIVEAVKSFSNPPTRGQLFKKLQELHPASSKANFYRAINLAIERKVVLYREPDHIYLADLAEEKVI